MFDEYRETLRELNELEEDTLVDIQGNIKSIQAQIKELEDEIEKLETESNDKNSPHIRAIISKEAAKIEEDFRKRLAVLSAKKKGILEQESAKREALINGIDLDKATEKELEGVYNTIQSYKDSVDIDNVTDLSVPLDTVSDLKKRAKIFTKHFNMVDSEPKPLCNKVAEAVSLNNIFQGINNPKVAIGAMTSYIVVGLVSTLYLPVVAIAGYVGLTALSVRDAMSVNKAKSILEKEFWLLQESYKNLNDMHKEMVEEKLREANDKADRDLAEALKQTEKEEDEIQADYKRLLNELRAMEDDPDFITSNLSIFRNKLKSLEDTRNEYEEELENYKDELNDCINDIASLRNKIKSLQKQIMELYGGELKPGTDRLLTKELFLGFENSGEIRMFDYNGKSSVIFYSGESVDTTDFVMKLFIGFLKRVNIASLTIYIMDTKTGAPRFSPFTQEDLSEAIHICSTKEQCTQVLNDMHSILEERNKSILSYSSNIESFNKEMLAKNSLTKEYIILLIQESSQAIFNNPKFEQVLSTGSDVGIIPIVFISQSWYNSILKGENDMAEASYNMLKSIKQNWYIYSSVQDVLKSRGKSFITDNLKRLENIINDK